MKKIIFLALSVILSVSLKGQRKTELNGNQKVVRPIQVNTDFSKMSGSSIEYTTQMKVEKGEDQLDFSMKNSFYLEVIGDKENAVLFSLGLDNFLIEKFKKDTKEVKASFSSEALQKSDMVWNRKNTIMFNLNKETQELVLEKKSLELLEKFKKNIKEEFKAMYSEVIDPITIQNIIEEIIYFAPESMIDVSEQIEEKIEKLKVGNTTKSGGYTSMVKTHDERSIYFNGTRNMETNVHFPDDKSFVQTIEDITYSRVLRIKTGIVTSFTQTGTVDKTTGVRNNPESIESRVITFSSTVLLK